MKKAIQFLAWLGMVAVTACGRPALDAPLAQPLEESPVLELNTASLAGRRVEDALMVVFRDGLSATEWRRVFDDSRDLSQARGEMVRINRRINELEGREGAEDEVEKLRAERDDRWVPQVGEAIVRVYERAAYLAVWDAGNECRFEGALLVCRRDLDARSLPLAGGIPLALRDMTVARSELHGRLQRPFFSLELQLSSPSEEERKLDPPLPDFGAFCLQLMLFQTPDPDFLTGQVRVLPDSRFLKEGVPVAAALRGYTEWRLASP